MDDYSFIGSILDVPSHIMSWFNYIVDTLLLVVDSIKDLYEMLLDINAQCMMIADNPATLDGTLPIIAAIGNFRYVVGNPIFYTFYILALLGCVFTVYTIVTKLIKAMGIVFDSVASFNPLNLLRKIGLG